MITAKMILPYLMKCLAVCHIVSHLCDADSLASFYRLEAECLEFFIVHRLGQVMDTQTSLWHKHTYVPKLGPLYFFKLRETGDTKYMCQYMCQYRSHSMIKCKIIYYALKIILQVETSKMVNEKWTHSGSFDHVCFRHTLCSLGSSTDHWVL